MRRNKITTRAEAEAQIEALVAKQGMSHTHNLIGMVLREVDRELGRSEANRLIEEYSLDILFGVNKEPEQAANKGA